MVPWPIPCGFDARGTPTYFNWSINIGKGSANPSCSPAANKKSDAREAAGLLLRELPDLACAAGARRSGSVGAAATSAALDRVRLVAVGAVRSAHRVGRVARVAFLHACLTRGP